MILPRLSVVTQDTHLITQLNVVSYNRAGLTERTEIFAGIKTEATCISKTPDLSALVCGTMRLRCVFDNKETMLAREIQYGIHVGRLSEEVHRHHSLRASGQRTLKLSRVHRVGALVDVHENRCGSRV